jgi:hypothetical protein
MPNLAIVSSSGTFGAIWVEPWKHNLCLHPIVDGGFLFFYFYLEGR